MTHSHQLDQGKYIFECAPLRCNKGLVLRLRLIIRCGALLHMDYDPQSIIPPEWHIATTWDNKCLQTRRDLLEYDALSYDKLGS